MRRDEPPARRNERSIPRPRWAVTSPLDAVAFLTRSANRGRVLAALTDGPAERVELAEAVGVSRVTAGRILDDLVERGWVAADGRTYRATPVGAVVSAEFRALLEAVASAQRVAAVAPRFPDAFDVDLRRLRDARVTVPTRSDPVAPVRRSTELMRAAGSIRGLGSGIAPDALRVNRDCVVEDGQSFEVVFSGDVLELVAADPRLSRWMRELLDAGGVVHRHAAVPLLAGEFDGAVVALGVPDESGVPCGTVETDDEAVLDWFEATFDRYRAEATPVGSDAFTA